MPITLTNKEQDVLNLLLDTKKSLTASEIVAHDKNLNNNTVQSVLRSLLKKGQIEVAEIVYSGKALCRSYQPTAEAREAVMEEFALHFRSLRKSVPMPQIFAGLIGNENDKQAVIDELEAFLAEKRLSLPEEGK